MDKPISEVETALPKMICDLVLSITDGGTRITESQILSYQDEPVWEYENILKLIDQAIQATSDGDQVLQDLYDSEINFEMSWFWDGGMDLSLGDKINGYAGHYNTRSLAEGIKWLKETACREYPDSTFSRKYSPQQKEGGEVI